MRVMILLTVLILSGYCAPKNSDIFKKCKNISRKLLNKNINDSKGLELISFMKYLDSRSSSLKKLLKEIAGGKVEFDKSKKADVDGLVSDLLEKGRYYQDKKLRNRAAIYYFMAYYLKPQEKSEKMISGIGFYIDNYPMISDLAGPAKADRPPKKTEKKIVRKINIEDVNKVINKELNLSISRKKMEIDEDAKIMKGSREDIGYQERRSERVKQRKESREKDRKDFRNRAGYNQGRGGTSTKKRRGKS